MKTKFVLRAILGASLCWLLLATIAGCSSDDSSSDDSSTASFADALNAAVSVMTSAAPTVSDGSIALRGIRQKFQYAFNLLIPKSFATAYGLSAVWATSVSGEKITIPGGSIGGCTEPQYNSQNLPSTVSVGDYIGMAIDSNYQRCSSGGGNYRPTIFGRFENIIDILGYLDSFLPKDSAGVYTDSSGDQAIVVDSTNVVVRYTVDATSDSTYYDKRVYVTGYIDSNANGAIDISETQMFSNIMWLRNNSSATNFMMAELGDYFDTNGSNGNDGVIDSATLGILNYNKLTGKMMFEYTEDSASAGLSGVTSQPTNPNLSIMRLLLESSGGAGHILNYSGVSKATDTGFTAFTVYAPNGQSSSSASASVNYENSGATDTITGNVCVDTSDGSAVNNVCSGHGASVTDISSALSSAMSTIRSNTGLLSNMANKGFSETSTDWTNATTRDNWLDQGEAISVGFDTASEMASQTDGTP